MPSAQMPMEKKKKWLKGFKYTALKCKTVCSTVIDTDCFTTTLQQILKDDMWCLRVALILERYKS